MLKLGDLQTQTGYLVSLINSYKISFIYKFYQKLIERIMKINKINIFSAVGLILLISIPFVQTWNTKTTLKNGQNTICTYLTNESNTTRITYKIDTGEEFVDVIGTVRLGIEKGEKYQMKYSNTFFKSIRILYWAPVFDEKDCYITKLTWIDVDDDEQIDGSTQKVHYGYEIGNQKFERVQRLKDMNLKNEDLDKLEVLYKKENPRIAYLRKKIK